MARLPARVDWITHERTGVKVALRLNKKTMTFQAEYAGQSFASKDGGEIREQILDLIEESHRLTFHPLIRIRVPEPSFHHRDGDLCAYLTLSVDRFFFSKEGELRELGWEDHESGRVHKLRCFRPQHFEGKATEFILPYAAAPKYSYGDYYYYLPYSQEAWEGLKKIVEVIQKAGSDLNTLLADARVMVRLIMIGMGVKYPLLEIPGAAEECDECGCLLVNGYCPECDSNP